MRLFDIDQNEQKRTRFNSIISRIIPQGVDWSIDQSESSQWVLRFLGDEKAHSAEGVGEGIASLFTLVAAFYDSEPGDIIVIDEPELSLHPAYQKRLSNMISEFGSHRQIIISSHSPYLVDAEAIRNGAELCRTWDSKNGTVIRQLENEGHQAWRNLTGLNINNPHQFGLDAKEVFFLEDGVLVVEGQEDVALMPKLFDNLQVFPKAEFFGWGAGGAGNIKHVLTILNDLGFERVSAIYDGDKSQEMQETKARFDQYLVCRLPALDIREKKQRFTEAKQGLMTSDGSLQEHNLSEAREFANEIKDYFEVRPEG